jgi:hypothetical protein
MDVRASEISQAVALPHGQCVVANSPAAWSVAITASREQPQTLLAAIDSIRSAACERALTIDVLVNGNEGLASGMHGLVRDALAPRPAHALLRLWQLPVADKASAINHYIQTIWPVGTLGFFMDGNVRVLPDSLRVLEQALARSPPALACTGVPTKGFSASRVAQVMAARGGLHGSLFAVRPQPLEEMRRRRLLLPRGLYRVDGLLGAFFAFNLDPRRFDWEPSRVLVETRASWGIERPRVWRPSYWRTMVKRRQRQAQGRLESAAFSNHLHRQRLPIEALPRTARDLVSSWLASMSEAERRMVLRAATSRSAWRRLQSTDVREQGPAIRPDLEVVC